MELEEKFLVLKWDDIEKALIKDDKMLLQILISKVNNYRKGYGKPVNSYLVVNQDEPYAPEVLKLMEQNES